MKKPNGRTSAPRKSVAVRLREPDWVALRGLAERRALAEGGRASASAVIVDLIRQAAARGRKSEAA